MKVSWGQLKFVEETTIFDRLIKAVRGQSAGNRRRLRGIGQGIKPDLARLAPLARIDSEQAAKHDRVNGRPAARPVIAGAAGDFGEARPKIKRQSRCIIRGNLEKDKSRPACGGFVDKRAKGGAGAPLAAVPGMGREGQHLGLVNNDSAKHETGSVANHKDRGISQKAVELVSAPAAGVSESKRMGAGKRLGQIGHGRITGGASRDGAASAART